MPELTDIQKTAHDVRNNIHAFEMALTVLEQNPSPDNVHNLIGLMKSEVSDTKRNLEHFIALVESKLDEPR